MKRYDLISRILEISTIVLLCAMCANVAYEYRSMLCAGMHNGASAPASIAFLLAIPYAVGICACLLLYRYFNNKNKR